jgi:outer membrane protein, multidrug efflux system
MRSAAAGLLAAGLLTGCMTLGPDYQRPKMEMPDKWPGEAAASPVSGGWWKAYNDPALERMVDEALVHNLDLRLAIARVSEARAFAGIANADRYPGVAVNAGASRNRLSQESPQGVPAGVDPNFSIYSGSVSASWEIDFWGRVRRANEAARAELLAARYNRDAVQLSLVTDVARSYFALRSLDAQIEVTERTIASRVAYTKLQRLRFQSGVTSELDLRQVEAETAQAQALLPALEQQRTQLENALAVLLGRNPRDIVGKTVERGSAIEALTVPPTLPSGLPSEMLERRPDLRQAEQSLVAANARIGQAKAAYYPTISLTGLLGGASTSLNDLFSGPARVWQFSADAALTVFDAGRTRSQVEAAQAREQQALTQYQLTVQNAFRETLDALTAQRKAREVLEAESTRVVALEAALRLAQLRYDNGVSSFLDVLTAERGLLDAQLNRVEAQRAQLAATADLVKALGGGWQDPGMERTADATQAPATR